jgi:HK97 family phage prohead protease
MGTPLKDPALEHDNFIRKGYVAASVDIKEDERAIIALITTDALDRDAEVLLPKGIVTDEWHKNRQVLWTHDYHGLPVGKGQWIKRQPRGLLAKFEPAPTEMGEQVYELYKKGFLKAFSIGFVPIEWREPTEKDIKAHPEWAGVKRIYTKVELLEFSAVPIPSNRDALVQAVGKGLVVPKELQEALGDIPPKAEVKDAIATMTAEPEEDADTTTGEPPPMPEIKEPEIVAEQEASKAVEEAERAAREKEIECERYRGIIRRQEAELATQGRLLRLEKDARLKAQKLVELQLELRQQAEMERDKAIEVVAEFRTTVLGKVT